MPVRRSSQTKTYGFPGPLTIGAPKPIEMKRDPTAQDEGLPGQIWLNQSANTAFLWINSTAAGNIWISSPVVGATVLANLLVTPGNLTVDTGNLLVTLGTITSGAGIQAGTTLNVGTDATVAGNLAVTGNSVLNGTLTVNGLTDLVGGFNVAGGAAFHVGTTDNVVGAISFTANGGAAETILIQALQGTSATAIELRSQVGGVNLEGGLGTAQAITFNASDAAGGMQFAAGTGGIEYVVANGDYIVASGTGNMIFSADAAATTIDIGTGAGVVKTINIGGTGANPIAIGNTQAAGSIAMGTAMTAGTISIGGTGNAVGAFNLAPGTGAQTVAIANANGAKTVNIGGGTGGNTISINHGVNGAPQITNINTGASGDAQTVNILTGVAVAGNQTFNVLTANGATANIINIGSGNTLTEIELGSTNTTSFVHIHAGTLGIQLDSPTGNVSLTAVDVNTASTAAATNHVRVGSVTSTGFTTAAQTLTGFFDITNNTVLATSQVMVTISQSGVGAAGQMGLASCTVTAGHIIVSMYNWDPVDAIAGDVSINFWILD